MTARLLRLILRLPRSSAAARATDHDMSNRALFKYRDAVCVILTTYIGARYAVYYYFEIFKNIININILLSVPIIDSSLNQERWQNH